MPSVTIVGAGVAGLTIGHQLARQGYAVTVLENTMWSAGWAGPGTTAISTSTSVRIGSTPRTPGWRILSATPWRRTPSRFRERAVSACSAVPRMAAPADHPLRHAVRADVPGGFHLVREEKLAGESFEADIVNKYGRTLYSIFLNPYTAQVPVSFADRTAPRLGPGRRQPGGHRQARGDGVPLVAAQKHADPATGRHDVPVPAGRGRPLLGEARRQIDPKGGRVLTTQPVIALRPPASASPPCAPAMRGSRSTPGVDGADHACERDARPPRCRARVPVDDLLQLRDRRAVQVRFPVDLLRRRRIFSRLSAPTVPAGDGAPGQEWHLRRGHVHQGDERWENPER